MSKNDDIAITKGSSNVFSDLGLPNPEERLLKARLASVVYDVLEARDWTQAHAAEVLGVAQPDVSNIVNGRLKNFSVERLLHFLSRLEQRVTITVQDEASELPPQSIVIAAEKAAKQFQAE